MTGSSRLFYLTARLAAAPAVLAGVLLSSVASAAPVQTDGGQVEGVEENGALVFKGIPFAAPPVGPLRWRAPQPPAPWPGVRNADRYSPICMQRGAYPEDSPPEPMSEDCLYLNVWVPVGARDARLPVMVWIYGGGLLNGSASTPLYAGDALSRRDVIVVTANYRLGALGFLAHPELTRESAQKVSGNYGLLDQLEVLNWVQRNIAAFGGDPHNVTAFGQSSGSISISALIASPMAHGLFRRAIGQSGGLFEPLDVAPEFKLEGAEQVGRAFAEQLGATSLEALRALPASAIVARPFHPQPNIDGYILRETPHEVFAHEHQNDVDILIGSNEGEGLYFTSGRAVGAANLSNELKEDFPAFVVSLIGPKTPADDETARAAFLAFEGNMRFGWNMWAWARLHAAAGKGKTYFYRFSHTPPGEEGATHGAEMPYVFDHLDLQRRSWTEKDRRLAHTMGSYWTNFAKTGDPNGEGLPDWPAFTPSSESALLIDNEIHASAVPNEANLVAIDRLYWSVRVLLKYGYVILGVAVLVVLTLIWRVAAFALRRRKASSRSHADE
jgi:para-nitrobenzyl esterase